MRLAKWNSRGLKILVREFESRIKRCLVYTDVAQWQSNGFLIRGLQVRILPSVPKGKFSKQTASEHRLLKPIPCGNTELPCIY